MNKHTNKAILVFSLIYSLNAIATETDAPSTAAEKDSETVGTSGTSEAEKAGEVDATQSENLVAAVDGTQRRALLLETMAVSAEVKEATLGGIDIKQLPLASTIINPQEINRLKFVDPDELLDRIPGESLVRNLRIPVGNKSYTVPLIDGVALGSPLNGATQDFGTDISAQDIQRIELFKGPVSALYHNNAFGGVINVISKGSEDLPEQNVRVWGEAGKFDRYRTGASAQGRINDDVGYVFDYSFWDIGASRPRALVESLSSPILRQTGQQRHQATGKMIFHPDDDSSLMVRGAFLKDRNTVPGELLESEFNFDEEQAGRTRGSYQNIESYLGSAIYNRDMFDAGHLTVNFLYRYTEDRGDSVRGPLFDDEDTDINAKIMYRHDFDLFDSNIIIGTDIYHGINDDRNPNLLPQNVTFDYATTSIYSGFAQLQFSPLEDLEITAGVRHESIELEHEARGGRSSTVFNRATYDSTLPKVGISYNLFDNHLLWGAYGEGFLVPTTAQLFTSRSNNPDLEPEEAEHFEIGIRGSFPIFGRALSYDTSYYYQDITNFIVTTAPTPGARADVLNAGKVNVQGVESVVEYQPTDFIRFGLTHTYARNRYRDFIDGNGIDLSGQELSRSPHHHFNGRVAIMPLDGLAIELEVDSISSYKTRDNPAEDPAGRFSRDERINVRLTYDQGPLELWFHALNIGDVKEDRVGFNTRRGERSIRTVDGLQVFGGFAYNFY